MPLPNYILGPDGRTPEPCPEVLDWAAWYETADRTVSRAERAGTLVSTVFLGVDHRFRGEGPPLVFETMVFGAGDEDFDGLTRRYATWEEAEAGHREICARVWPHLESS
jgi:hypothetical protein